MFDDLHADHQIERGLGARRAVPRPCRRDSRCPAPWLRAWSRAKETLRSEASRPVTSKPRRASGSQIRPPPQPTSSARRPWKGARSRPSLLKSRQRPFADEPEANRVERVQRRELAPGVPPILGDRREPCDIGGVDATCWSKRVDGHVGQTSDSRPACPVRIASRRGLERALRAEGGTDCLGWS